VGADPAGSWLAADLAAEGVDPALIIDPLHRTAVIQLVVEPGDERTMVHDRGANAHWAEGDVKEEVIASADLLHVTGYVLFDPENRYGALRAMEYARDHSVPISLDPSSHGPLNSLGAGAFWSLTGRVNVFLPNRSEAKALTGCVEPEKALLALQEHADVVAIKLDRDGCVAAAGAPEQRDSIIWQPAPPTDVVNATGAGDAFDAGFLATWLRDRDLAAACRRGVEFGSRAVGLPGTR